MQINENYFDGLYIENCIIDNLNISGTIFMKEVIIKNSLIISVEATGTWFEEGLDIKNCIFENKITFEAGGHNKSDFPIIIENNIFNCFVDFFDCQYTGSFTFKNNHLLNGSNLLGNLNKPFKVLFNGTKEIENNIGKLNANDDDFEIKL